MGVLTGKTVLDFTSNAAGPYLTMLLADLGATVIKLESPGRGDAARGWGSARPDGRSFLFLATNRNKRSVALDLKHPRRDEVLKPLIDQSDILVESFGPGAAEKLGVSFSKVSETNPHLVYCSVSGYGRTGPLSHKPGFDMALQAYTGILNMTGEPDGPPVRVPISALDLMTGSMGALAVVAAIGADQGNGQHIEVSLYETAMNMLLYAIPQYSLTGTAPQRLGGEFAYLYPYGVFAASDEYFYLGVGSESAWQRFTGAIQMPELRDDPRFATNSDRIEHRDDLRAILATVFAQYSASYWIDLLGDASVPVEPINDVGDAVLDPHAKERGAVVEIPGMEEPALMPGIPFKMERGTVEPWGAPPLLGEHTEEVLRSIGFEGMAIDSLASDRVIG